MNEYLGLLYTGLKNGSIIEIDPFTKRIRIIYSSLSVDDHQLDCGEFSFRYNSLNECCCSPLGNDDLEHVCGRPLGLRRFSNDELIIAQAYYEIFKLNIKTSLTRK